MPRAGAPEEPAPLPSCPSSGTGDPPPSAWPMSVLGTASARHPPCHLEPINHRHGAPAFEAPRGVWGDHHCCRGLPLPHCSPTSTLATERGVSCNTAQHPTALASHPESSQLSPSCPSWRGQSPQEKPAPSPLPILQHLHPGVLPLPTWIPPPFLSWELHPVLKAWGGVTSPGSPAQVW